MEIIFDDVNYKEKLRQLNFSISSNYVYGFYLEDPLSFEKILARDVSLSSGTVSFKGLKRKKPIVSIVDSKYIYFYTGTVKGEINYYCKKNKITDKSFIIFLENYLREVGLNEETLDKKIEQLSTSERYLFYIFLKTLFKFDVVIFKNLYFNLDKNNRKIIKNLLKMFSSKNKIVIVEDNMDVLYEVTNKTIIIKNGKVILSGNTLEELVKCKELLNYNIIPPTLPYITYLAKERKGVKLFYHTDIRDIIKDIYKHV